MIFDALFPIFALIALGFLLKRSGFPSGEFWPAIERLTYFLLFPCLLFVTLFTAKTTPFGSLAMTGGLVVSVLFVSWAADRARVFFGFDGPSATSVFQGSIRPNTYVGLAACAGLYGAEGLQAAAIAVAVLVPTVNVLCVSFLMRHGSMASEDKSQRFLSIAKNPLILACVAGMAANLAGLAIPGAIVETLSAVGRASLPMGLLAVGSGLRFESLGVRGKQLGAAAVLKLLLLPLACVVAAKLLGVSGAQLGAAVIFSAIPASASSYVLAGQLGGGTRILWPRS